MRKYNIHELSKVYVKGFCKFLKSNKLDLDKESGYTLFIYSMKKLCCLETSEYSLEIRKYSDKCVKYLKHLKGTPKDYSITNLEERIDLVECSSVYFVTVFELSENI